MEKLEGKFVFSAFVGLALLVATGFVEALKPAHNVADVYSAWSVAIMNAIILARRFDVFWIRLARNLLWLAPMVITLGAVADSVYPEYSGYASITIIIGFSMLFASSVVALGVHRQRASGNHS